MPYKKIEKFLAENKYNFFHIQSTKSTMNEVKSFLDINKKNCIFLADEQTSGRGRRGSNWESPLGNIYCSISFDNFLSIKDHFIFSILICVSIKMTLEKFKAKNIQFKWPNDIFYKNKKFSGMISEMYNIDNLKKYIIVGFGINFNSSPNIKHYPTTHIRSFCDIDEINKFLESFFEILFLNYKNIFISNYNYLIDLFDNSLMYKNENIKIVLPDESIKSGFFKGINIDGSLKLETKDRIENIYNGSIRS